MYIQILNNFNNYYNRRVSPPMQSLDDYSSYVTYQTDNVNFNPNDGIQTQHVIGTYDYNGAGDYLVIYDGETSEIQSRWFIVESVRTRSGQYQLTLKRDVIADYYELIRKSPMFIEKAIVNQETDPATFNLEDMSFNQIKQEERLLKDNTGCGWLVGYYSKDYAAWTEQSIPIKVANSLNNLKQLNYTYDDLVAHFNDFKGEKQNEKLILKYQRGEKWVHTIAIPFNKKDSAYIETSSLDVLQNGGLHYSSSVTAQSFGSVQLNVSNNDTQSLGQYNSQQATQELLDLNGLTCQMSDGSVYTITVKSKDESVKQSINITSGKLFDVFKTYAESIPGYSYGTPNSESFVYEFETAEYEISGQRQTNLETAVKFTNENIQCSDAPYNIIAIPYQTAKIKLSNESEAITQLADVSMTCASTLIKKFSSGGLYDFQLLPYCPLQNIQMTSDGEIDLTLMQKDVDYTLITDNETTSGVILHVSRSRFTFNITDMRMFTPNNPKISNQVDMFRLCSPNYSSQFEFSLAKNGGIDYWNVDCEYKPYQPYIHINPNFKKMYGKDFNDVRGLICSGDYSLPMISDAWESYQLQNKNYQAMFDRQIESLDLQQKVQGNADWVKAITGTLSGAAGGALAGSSILPGIGIAIGGAVGGIASAIGGAADIAINKVLRKDARDLTIDQFNYQLGNVKALPYTISKTSSILQPNNKVFPIIELYSCTDEERQALADKIFWNGMSVGRIGTIEEFENNSFTYNNKTLIGGYIKGQLIQLLGTDQDSHLLYEISNELNNGVYLNTIMLNEETSQI